MGAVDERRRETIAAAYAAFNARDIDAALRLLRPDVHWPNGMEGGYVDGHDEVRAYWTRQWRLIDPHVEPLAMSLEPDGRVAVRVHQVVRDMEGEVVLDQMVRHVYGFAGGLIAGMEIQKED